MSAVRGLLRDLVERKLWPVAVLLLVAALGVPVYLGRSSHQTDAPVAPGNVKADTGKASKAAVSLEDPAAGDDRPGSVRNPFKQLHLPKQTANAGNPAPSSDGGSSPSTGDAGNGGSPTPATGGNGSGSGTGTGTGDGTSTPTPSSDADPLDTYHLTLRFGHADADSLTTYKDVARLSPLPTADNPFFVYTGVLKDGKTAVFLLSSDATATGDGHCKPSAKSCETIEVKQGDTEFFDLTIDGKPVQYQLDVVKVFKKGAASTAAAAAANERHSVAGAAELRGAHARGSSSYKGAAAYRWLPEKGVLVHTPKQGNARASVNGAAAASLADAAGALPGVPVWHWALGG